MKWITVLVFSLIFFACGKEPQQSTVLNLQAVLGDTDNSNFKKVLQPREFQFPEDHLAHDGYKNEWWYLTGNLQDQQGRPFAYQLTLFRIALSNLDSHKKSAWATQIVWMGHLALTDIQAKKHHHAQRLSREAIGLAGVSAKPFAVWVYDWKIQSDSDAEFPWLLQAKDQGFALDLHLEQSKAPVLQGDKGLSQKSSQLGNASYYYSFTRLKTTGNIQIGEKKFTVSGDSWLDREWSTSALAEDQTGWDWFSLQLYDQTEVMFYRMRKTSGSSDPYSAGVWVDSDGSYEKLSLQQVELTVINTWTSPTTGKKYPIEWKMKIDSRAVTWRIKAAIDDQEMLTAIDYWEGAVVISDFENGEELGRGFLEMTGYSTGL